MIKLLPLFLFPGLLKAKGYKYEPMDIDGGSLPLDADAYTIELITNGQQHPNLTRGVQFNIFGTEDNAGSISVPKNVQWTWRVNVSDFSAPNAEGYDPARDPHVVTSTYDLNWPGGDNLTAALGIPNAGICVTFVDAPYDWPVNVTNAYTEDDTNSSSCVGALGQACVDAILSMGRAASLGRGQCLLPAESWFQLSQCQSTLGYASVSYRSSSIASRALGFLNSSATVARYDGEAWFGTLSGPQYGSGSGEYYTIANRLHIALVNPVLPTEEPINGTPGGWSQDPQLLCMRVNATKLSTKDPNGDGVTWTSEAVLEGAEENVGCTSTLDKVWLLFAATLASLAFVTKL